MIAGVGEYRARIQRFRSHKELAKAQYVAAKAQLAISEAAAGLSSQLREVGAKIDHTMLRVEDMNLRAAVTEELEATGMLDPTWDGRGRHRQATARTQLRRIRRRPDDSDEARPAPPKHRRPPHSVRISGRSPAA